MALKWPNDVYARDGASWRKLGGVLCQSTYWRGRFVVTVGLGLNVTNAEPSVCVAQLTAQPVGREVVLAAIMSQLEPLLLDFGREGFTSDMRADYERRWMHTGQRVTAEGGDALVVEGLSQGGFLRARDEGTGTLHELHPDGNSLDWFQGLIKRKL